MPVLGPRQSVEGWGPGALLQRVRIALKLEGLPGEYHGLRKLLRRLLCDAATHEEPCLSAAGVLLQVLSMQLVSFNTPGAERTRRRLLAQYLNCKAEATKDKLNSKVQFALG